MCLSPGSLEFESKILLEPPKPQNLELLPSNPKILRTLVTPLKSSEQTSSLSQTKSIYRPNYENPNFRPIGLPDLWLF